MRVVYAGSPATAIIPLEALLRAGIEVVGVLSQPPRLVGRKRVLTQTPVHRFAEERGVPVFTPSTSTELLHNLEAIAPDLAVAVAYGRLIDEASLRVPRNGWWNVHFSLLPRWRGATPVQHAILAGDENTGVTIFQMDQGLDTGEILGTTLSRIRSVDTAGDLLISLSVSGSELLVGLIRELERGPLTSHPQSGTPTFAPKLSRHDGRIDWSQPAEEISRRFRAVTPEPGCFTGLAGSEKTLGIVRMFPSSGGDDIKPGVLLERDGHVLVGTSDGAIELAVVKPSGKSEMSAIEWWRGAGREAAFV